VSCLFTFLVTGFFYKGYLFGKCKGGLSKYQRIVNILKETYQEYPGYELYVCGHSLGGALAILLAFTLAATEDVPESPKPIKTITFACPPVGDKGYGRAFEVSRKLLFALFSLSFAWNELKRMMVANVQTLFFGCDPL
jgi:pimeloyl-ACP methyl ester carboxylesterase